MVGTLVVRGFVSTHVALSLCVFVLSLPVHPPVCLPACPSFCILLFFIFARLFVICPLVVGNVFVRRAWNRIEL